MGYVSKVSKFVRMKILLINPPRSPHNDILRFAPEEARPFIHRRLIGPPLGLLTIASSVPDHEVVLFDMKGEYDLDPATPSLDILTLQLLKEHEPQVVGVTVKTSEFPFAVEICHATKEYDPSVVTVVGGLHPTLRPMDFTDPAVDVIVPGQAVHLFRKLVATLEGHGDLHSIPGIWLNGSNGPEKNPGMPLPVDPAGADFVFPDRGRLKRWISTYKVGKSPDPSTYVFTSLGCPYKCTFCSIWGQFRGRYHQRGVESLIAELKQTDDYPVVRFADANTVVDIDFMNTLFDRIREEGIEKFFIMDIRADVAVKHPELIEKMARGGLRVVICGFESFRDDELKRYKKESGANQNLEAIRVFDASGIMVRGNYVIPNDYTDADFDALAEYSARNPVVYAGYTILTPMPGTVYYKEVEDQIVEHDYSRYNFFNSVLKTVLPYERFHERVGGLWLIKKGKDVI
jgi:hopanoid C-3 methylase